MIFEFFRVHRDWWLFVLSLFGLASLLYALWKTAERSRARRIVAAVDTQKRLDSALTVIRRTIDARDMAMDDEDRRRYLFKDTAFVVSDVFRRAHEAEAALRHMQQEVHHG